MWTLLSQTQRRRWGRLTRPRPSAWACATFPRMLATRGRCTCNLTLVPVSTDSSPLRSYLPAPGSQARPWSRCLQRAQACGLRQVHYITAPQPLAAGLVKYGDFLAPPKGAMRYGYGCLLYSQYCDFSTQGALAARFRGSQ